MSETPGKRDQFSARLQCTRCGAVGRAVWEENAAINPDGPMGRLITLSDGFIQRMRRSHQGPPEIACVKCGLVHAD